MSESEKKKGVPPGSAKDDGKATNKKPTPPVADQRSDSDDIERAVFDGMQDLRVKKTK